MDEMEIRDLDQVTRAYVTLLNGHVRLLRILLPTVRWKEVPVVVVLEQNTYVNALSDVKDLLEHSLACAGFRVLFYSKWSHGNGKYMLGKLVSAKTKLDMVLSTVRAIECGTLKYCDCVMSLGCAVLAEASSNSRAVEAAIGAARGSGSSTKSGSSLGVHMYRRSRKGGNLATDVTAQVLETRDAMILRDDRLYDKAHAEYGKQLLGKLREEMAAVVITESVKGRGIVTTGGKRSIGGQYTRDDMLSAFLLLCHTQEEITRGDQNVNVHEGVFCQ